jgi:hypothetical protein
MTIFTLPLSGGGPIIIDNTNAPPAGTTQINFTQGGTLYIRAALFGGSGPIASNVFLNNLTTNTAVVEITMATVTQPRSFRHSFGESVRLSFWFVGGGQGPLSGAFA